MNVERIRDLCREHGTTIKQLERDLGIGNGVIARWETSSPTLAKAKAVADYFGVTLDELLKEDGGEHCSPLPEDGDMVALKQSDKGD